MKPFSSSILMMTESTVPQSSVKALPEKESYLVQMLQFNEAAAKAELDSARDYYLALLNLANKETNNFDPAINAAFNQYEAVRTTASHIMWDNEDTCRCLFDEYNFEEICNKASKILKNNPKKIRMITDGSISAPVRIDGAILLKPVKDVCDAGITALQNNTFTEFASTVKTMASPTAMIRKFAELMNLENSADTFEDLVDSYQSMFKIDTAEVYMGADIRSAMFSATDKVYFNRFPAQTGQLQGITDTFMSVLRVNSNDLNPNDVRTVIRIVCDMIVMYTTIILKTNQICDNFATKITAFNCKAVADAIGYNGDFSECALIESAFEMFGEKIDLDTLFDTLDPYDFNPTEFMDIRLVAEHESTMYNIEVAKYALDQSAKLMAEGKYEELTTLNEALSQKIKDGFNKLVEAIKKMLSKFVESIMFNIGPEKAWLEKYKNTILNNTFDANQQVTIYCDLDSAMQNIEGVVPPTISYQQLVSEVGKDFNNAQDPEKLFFEHYFTHLAGLIGNGASAEVRKFNGYNDASLADKCKWALGAKWPENISKDVKFGDLKISDMYNWLMKTDKLAKTTQQQIRNIERTVANYTASAAAAAKNQPAKNPQQAQSTTPPAADANASQTPAQTDQNASFIDPYGYIISEADLKNPPANNNNQGGDNGEQQSNNPKPDSLNKTRGDTDAEVKKADDASQVDKMMNIYLKVCKDVLAAKITAINYAHKEMLDIMRFIVKAKLGNSADLKVKGADQNNGSKPNNNGNTEKYDYGKPTQSPISGGKTDTYNYGKT